MSEIEVIAFHPPAYHSPRQLKSVIERAAADAAEPTTEEMFELVEQLSIHGLSDEYRAFMIARKPQIVRRNALARYAIHYQSFLNSCEGMLGKGFSQRLNRDLLTEVPQLIKRGRHSDRLLIVVPTYYNNVMMSLPLLDAFLERLGIDTLYLKATHASFPFYDGLYGFGSTRMRTADVLRDFCSSRGYTRVDLIGASSGGFFALWLGAQLGAGKVCVYGSDIMPTMRSKHLSREHIARSIDEEAIGEHADLSKIGEIHAYSGNMRSRDVECVTYLEQFPNVKTTVEIGVDHLVLLSLISRGYEFTDLST